MRRIGQRNGRDRRSMWTTGVATLAAMLAGAGAAVAQNDRIIDTPTGWGYLYGATSTQIATQINGGMRPFSVEQVGSGQYDVVLVNNSGPYAVTGSTITYNRTPQSMSDYLTANNLRLLDLEVYDDGSGGTRMTAITVPNSGATHTPGWGWLYNTSFAAISDWLTANPALRLIDLDVYTIGGTRYYSAVAVHNSGNNAQGWWYVSGATASQVTSTLTANNARLVHIELVSPGNIITPATYAAVMVSSNPGGGWWYPSVTSDQIGSLLAQNGARLTALKRYTNFSGQTRWAVAMVDNANPQTRRMREFVGSAINDGSFGFRLKQVNGPVLASLNENFVYEPASMLKILHAAYAVRQASLGLDNLNSMIYAHNRCTSQTQANLCPSPYPNCDPGEELLSTCIRWMMQISHNTRTRNIEERYGRATLNSFAAARGLTSTQINHTMGCGPMTNTMSLTDAVSFYEQIANGSLFSTAWRDQLFSLMGNLEAWGYGAYPRLSSIINQEAAATTLTSGEISQFRAAVRYANKGGGYGSGGLVYKTEGAWASLPFKTSLLGSWIVSPRQYAIAGFVHGSTDSTGADIIYVAKEEILREPIREALASWENACDSPGFSAHPSDQNGPLGGQVIFSAGATGSTYDRAFQWQQAGTGPLAVWTNVNNVAGRFSGATTTTLTISNIQASDARRYRLRITNRCGADNSNPALLTITAAPCYANCDGSTVSPVLNVDDFTCFINSYASAQSLPHTQQIQHYANCDNSSIAPVLNVDDFTCFINQYAQGCP